MSDKDFDQVFSNKLNKFEAEPSSIVWNNIIAELDSKPNTEKGSITFMRIAASVLILAAAGLYFLRPSGQKIVLHGIVAKQSDQRLIPNTSAAYVNNTNNVIINQTIAKPGYKRYKAVPMVFEQRPDKPVQNLAAANTVMPQQQSGDPDHNEVTAPQVQTIASVSKFNVGSPVSTPVKTDETPEIAPAMKEVSRKRKIHTLGDLLNVVIAKVDKRQDKLIQFTNDDDNDSFNVTGVNLGIISAKKEK